MAAHVGHLRYIIGSAVIFVIASLGCTAATTPETMLFWRAILGFSGAGLTMWWRASVYLPIPRQDRGKSMMRISVMLYLATTVGLLFSGYVTDNYGCDRCKPSVGPYWLETGVSRITSMFVSDFSFFTEYNASRRQSSGIFVARDCTSALQSVLA
jgi:MFS family permease